MREMKWLWMLTVTEKMNKKKVNIKITSLSIVVLRYTYINRWYAFFICYFMRNFCEECLIFVLLISLLDFCNS